MDLKGAFDKAKRTLLHQALCLLDLPESLQAPLLAWYQQNSYHIHHHGYECTIESNIGVRQGCVAAPLLWVCFMHLWQMHIAGFLSKEWVVNCLTIFADDIHASWLIENENDLDQALKSVRILLNVLTSFGMEVNCLKTVCLLCLQGTQASKLRKRYCGKTKQGNILRIPRLSDDDPSIALPLVHQHVYLGVVLSYTSYSYFTVKHRVACARKSFMSLRPWWAKNKLTLSTRVALWKSCIWSSLSYGLSAVGLDRKSQRLLTTTVMHQLRWLAQSPLRQDCESNAALLQRLGLWNPVEHLQQDTARHWIARWQLQSQKHIAENDVLHQSWGRLKQLVQFSSPAGQWHKNALLFHLRHHSNDESVTAILLALGVTEQELQAHAAYVRADTEAPADPRRIQITVDEFVHCPHCDATFPSVCGLRHHIGRKHGNEFITKASPIATTPESIRSLGQDGMPTCRRCGNCYVRWDEFTRHILEDRCHPKPGYVDVPVCLSQDKTVLKGLTGQLDFLS